MTARDEAFGRPGDEPHWTSGDKHGMSTAYSADSRVWSTLRSGHLTEVYYPSIDMPQIRDLRLAITDGEFFLHDEADRPPTSSERMCPSLGYRVRRDEPEAEYRVEKVVIADPHLPCVLQHVRVIGAADRLAQLRLYAICNPHLGGGGSCNNAEVFQSAGREVLVAERDGRWLAMAADQPFCHVSVGFVGVTGGIAALADGFAPKWSYASATNGNVALTGGIDLGKQSEFTLGLAFGESRHAALTTLFQSLATPFARHEKRFVEQWQRGTSTRLPLEAGACDGGHLYRASYSLLLGHEDKTFAGAQVASLSIPWGDVRSDKAGRGGYHLVWVRDLVQTATGLLAAGQTATPLRTLIYLAVAQLPDGGFPQNFWLEGRAFADQSQLDEVAFPILLARRLHLEGASEGFDASDLVRRAAQLLVLSGPVTCQERWEESSGYSPSTLATVIAGCVCAAAFAREAGDAAGATFVEDYADWLRENCTQWTVTNQGTLLEGVTRHFVRLHPAQPGHAACDGGVEFAVLKLASQPPGSQTSFDARDVVDAGFLELVRHGIFAADDPLVVDSLRVVDHSLKRDTKRGTAWRRYNHDGYGQRSDGSPYDGIGVGRAWPLLAGERGHYKLIADGDPSEQIRDLERFAGAECLLPEQVWDEPDVPEKDMRSGQPTGAARPLLWAHAEYVKLLRSVRDGEPYDRFPEVAERYIGTDHRPPPPEFWTFQHPTPQILAGDVLRICARDLFRLHFSLNGWQTVDDIEATYAYGLHYIDVRVGADQVEPIRFTMFWNAARRWEGRDFEVAVAMPDAQ